MADQCPEGGWTPETLHAYFTAQLAAHKENDASQHRAIEQRFQDNQIAVSRALEKAENASERRFESVNEFRKSQGDLVAGYMPRTEHLASHKGLADKVDALNQLVIAQTGKGSGFQASWMIFVVLASLGISIIALFIHPHS